MSEFALPEAFSKRIATQLKNPEQLERALDEESGTSIRYNERKLIQSGINPKGNHVPWNASGRYLEERPKFSLDPLYHAGLYYPMEASSMFLRHVLNQINLPEPGLILDLCAAPGGKSLILKDTFPNQLLVSNEIDAKRSHILKENAVRWGTQNHLVVQSDAARLQRSGLTFDLIVVDAPCSGEGLFRKDKKSRDEWTAERASGCALRQQEILQDVIPLLSPGGYLIYSTCTFNPDENIERVKQLMSGGLEVLDITIDPKWGIEKLVSGAAMGYQFWPHRVQGEGFFVSLLKDKREPEPGILPTFKIKHERFDHLKDLDLKHLIFEQWENKFVGLTREELQTSQALKGCGKIVKRGTLLGELKGKDFIPAHDLATQEMTQSFENKVALDETLSLDYLRGNALNLSCPKGPVLLTYQGLGIGFGKSNGTRINNLFPKYLRVF